MQETKNTPTDNLRYSFTSLFTNIEYIIVIIIGINPILALNATPIKHVINGNT